MTAVWIAGATAVMTLCGGILALRLAAYRGILYAFCAGALIASGLMEMVPNSLELLESTQTQLHHHHVLLACALGFLVFYVFEQATHQRETPDQQASHHAHAPHAGAWGAAGILVHSFVDGFAIGEGFHVDEHLGWTIALGVTLHKLADGASVSGIMLGTDHSASATRTMLYLTAAAPLVGVFTPALITLPPGMLALMLAWFAGVFLYLGAGSLLPAAHDASHSRYLPLATLAGVAFVYGAQLLSH